MGIRLLFQQPIRTANCSTAHQSNDASASSRQMPPSPPRLFPPRNRGGGHAAASCLVFCRKDPRDNMFFFLKDPRENIFSRGSFRISGNIEIVSSFFRHMTEVPLAVSASSLGLLLRCASSLATLLPLSLSFLEPPPPPLPPSTSAPFPSPSPYPRGQGRDAAQ